MLTQSNRTERARRSDLRFFRRLMVFLALIMVTAGGMIGVAPEWLGLQASQGRQVGSAFVLVGAADTLVLYFWNHLFG